MVDREVWRTPRPRDAFVGDINYPVPGKKAAPVFITAAAPLAQPHGDAIGTAMLVERVVHFSFSQRVSNPVEMDAASFGVFEEASHAPLARPAVAIK